MPAFPFVRWSDARVAPLPALRLAVAAVLLRAGVRLRAALLRLAVPAMRGLVAATARGRLVTGRLPLAGVDEQTLDELLGAVLAASDEPFDEVLALGFLSSMRREWAWRTSRGEPTANLARFRHLLEEDGTGEGQPGADDGEGRGHQDGRSGPQ